MDKNNKVPLILGVVAVASPILLFVLRSIIGYDLTLWTVVTYLGMICLAVSGFTQKKAFALVYPGASTMLYIIYSIIPSFSSGISFMYDLLPTLVWVALLVSVILWVLPNKTSLLGKYFWVVSAGLQLIYTIADIADIISYSYDGFIVPFYFIIWDILELALIVLLGLWIYCDFKVTPLEKPVNPSIARSPEVRVSASIQRLTTLKTLLDKGIITQEEFDMKKNDIMGTASNQTEELVTTEQV